MSQRILIRADASRQMGSGHVMRCLSLADSLRARGATVRFICRALEGHLQGLIEQRGFGVDLLPPPGTGPAPQGRLAHSAWLEVSADQDVEQTAAILEQGDKPDWLLVDHYALDAHWQRRLKGLVKRLGVIDDLADRAHEADLLLDPNLGADETPKYSQHVSASCLTLTGSRYALLRAEFGQHRARMRPRKGRLARGLVFLGGADAAGHTQTAIAGLARLQTPVGVDVVVGAANPNAAAIRQLCGQHGFEFSQAVEDMGERMSRADFAIGAGGSSTWERACLGLPSLIVVVADNQRPGAQAICRRGGAELIEAQEFSPEQLARIIGRWQQDAAAMRRMSEHAYALVDGRGAERVARLILAPKIALRQATETDSEQIFHWRNDEAVRRFSHDDSLIPQATHDRWFSDALAREDRQLLIASTAGQAVGVLRYDLSGPEALVSIYRVPKSGEPGIGSAILRTGSRWLARQAPQIRRVLAEVAPDNQASRWSFLEAGYRARAGGFEIELKDRPRV